MNNKNKNTALLTTGEGYQISELDILVYTISFTLSASHSLRNVINVAQVIKVSEAVLYKQKNKNMISS